MTKHEEVCGLPEDMDEDVYFCVCIIIRMERKRLIKKLKKEAKANACNCGEYCFSWDLGFRHAIDFLKEAK